MSKLHAGSEHAAAFIIYFVAAFAVKSQRQSLNRHSLKDLKSG